MTNNRENLARLISEFVVYDKKLMEHFRDPMGTETPETLNEFLTNLETKYHVTIADNNQTAE
jgi:hypothetical protein